MSVYPPHLIDSEKALTPSALIPFCEFQSSPKGQTRPDLPFIACDKFQATVLEGQLCYSVDLRHIASNKTKQGLRNGLMLALDTGGYPDIFTKETKEEGMIDTYEENTSSFRIYINTLEVFSDSRAGSYAMSGLQKMALTNNFVDLPEETKKCQIETYEHCIARRYFEAVKELCGCVPWALSRGLQDKVGCLVSYIFCNLYIDKPGLNILFSGRLLLLLITLQRHVWLHRLLHWTLC